MKTMYVCCLAALAVPALAVAEDSSELKAYLRALKSGSNAEQIRAAQDIAKLGAAAAGPAVPALCEAIADNNSKVAAAALEALEKVDAKLHKLLTALLFDGSEKKRSDAMQDISQLENVEVTVPVLIANVRNRIAKDNDRNGIPGDLVRAIDALQSIAPKNPSYLKLLVDASGPGNPRNKNRNYVIKALGDLAAENEKSIPTIKRALAASLVDRSKDTRVAALEAIGKIGLPAKDLAATVKKLKFDGEADVRDAASAALEKIQGK